MTHALRTFATPTMRNTSIALGRERLSNRAGPVQDSTCRLSLWDNADATAALPCPSGATELDNGRGS